MTEAIGKIIANEEDVLRRLKQVAQSREEKQQLLADLERYAADVNALRKKAEAVERDFAGSVERTAAV